MKINTNSENYIRFRKGLNLSSYFGGCLAFDCVMIPFSQFVLSGKFRILRPFAYLGTYGLSLCVGALAAGGVDWAADVVVDVINNEPEQPKHDIPEEPVRWYTETGSTKIDPKNATPSEEMELVNNFVDDAKIFEFESEEQAKAAGEKLHGMVKRYGFCDLVNYCASIGVKVPEDIYNTVYKYGWTELNLGRLGVEKFEDGKWILDAFKYNDISGLYKTLDIE